MRIVSALKARVKRERFIPSPLSVIVNPLCIIRAGLFVSISRIAPQISGKVLDFGCGSKPYELLFQHACQYVGTDIAVSGHDHSSSRIDVFYDGKSLPFDDDAFDSVVSFEVFEHIPNTKCILQEIHRVLKPNGRLLMSVPFGWHEHEIPFDYQRFTSFGIRYLLESHGFKIIQLDKTTTSVLAIFQLLTAYLSHNLAPKMRVLSWLFQLFVVFPLNGIAISLNSFLPRNYDFFCNLVILAERVE